MKLEEFFTYTNPLYWVIAIPISTGLLLAAIIHGTKENLEKITQ